MGLFYPKPWGKAFSVHSCDILINKRAREQPQSQTPGSLCVPYAAPHTVQSHSCYFGWVFSVFKIASALCCSLPTRGSHDVVGKGVVLAPGGGTRVFECRTSQDSMGGWRPVVPELRHRHSLWVAFHLMNLVSAGGTRLKRERGGCRKRGGCQERDTIED